MAFSFAARSDLTRELRNEYRALLETLNVEELVLEFLSYLDYTEETDSGREFHPIVISSCRVLMTEPLGMCLEKLRERVNKKSEKEKTK